jgi:hypothetical protein
MISLKVSEFLRNWLTVFCYLCPVCFRCIPDLSIMPFGELP